MFCPRCGAANDDSAVSCIACGRSLPAHAAPDVVPVRTEPEPAKVCEVVMPAKEFSAHAIASLILGILEFCLCCFSMPLSIGAVVCGHMAMAQFKREPGRYAGYGMAKAGLWLGYIGLALVAAFLLIRIITLLLVPIAESLHSR